MAILDPEGHGFVLSVARSHDGLDDLGPFVDHVSAALSLSPAAEYALRLCVEEAVANTVMHGGAADASGTVAIRVTPDATSVVVTIEDACPAFDPSEAPLPGPVAFGGLGLRLMRQYANAITYSRSDGTNRLTMTIARL
jgi:anti-sigma regulatory factor (Ser/Thr protein kinase)